MRADVEGGELVHARIYDLVEWVAVAVRGLRLFAKPVRVRGGAVRYFAGCGV